MNKNQQAYQDYISQSQPRNTNTTVKKNPYPVRKQVNARLPKGKIKLLSVVVMIYVLLWWSMFQLLPLNKVNRIMVIGANLSETDLVIEASEIDSWRNAKEVLNQRQKIEKNIIAANPIIEGVRFERNHWSELEIHVLEHELVGKVEYNHQIVPLLSNGEMLTNEFFETHWQASYLEQVPELIGFYQQSKLADMATLLKKMDANIVQQMVSIQLSQEVTKPNGIVIKMKDGNTVKAVMNTVVQRMAYYPKMMQQIGQKRGVINLEVEAYFTPY